ncbi:hypothetical protein EDC01DRAFT_141873 [Geopyxis carbonaria]|nr:hypothetical protein EDC01DRAFT_141873 [Geopyxis carbonaria]
MRSAKFYFAQILLLGCVSFSFINCTSFDITDPIQAESFLKVVFFFFLVLSKISYFLYSMSTVHFSSWSHGFERWIGKGFPYALFCKNKWEVLLKDHFVIGVG